MRANVSISILGNFTFIHNVRVAYFSIQNFCEVRILESHNVLPLFVSIVRYFLMAIYGSATSTLFFLRAMYAAKVDFCFLTSSGMNMPDWPSLSPGLSPY